MRRILITLLVLAALVVTMSILWIFCGPKLSLFLDRFGTIESASVPVTLVAYEASGEISFLHVNDLAFRLSGAGADPRALQPHFGTTKDEQFALSYGGKVFAFGSARPLGEGISAAPPPDDDASINIRHSYLSWPTRFDVNFMTGHTPSWKRHLYYQIVWKKPAGTKLEMLWRYEQYFYPGDGWTTGMMTREGFTGLIRVDISYPSPSPQSSP